MNLRFYGYSFSSLHFKFKIGTALWLFRQRRGTEDSDWLNQSCEVARFVELVRGLAEGGNQY